MAGGICAQTANPTSRDFFPASLKHLRSRSRRLSKRKQPSYVQTDATTPKMLGVVGQQCCVRFARGFSLRNVHDKTTRLASLLLLYKEDRSARVISERAADKHDHIFSH